MSADQETSLDYICGDADGNGILSIDDYLYIHDYLVNGGPAPEPLDAGDADCSGEADIDDAVYILSYIFQGGSQPCDTNGDGSLDC